MLIQIKTGEELPDIWNNNRKYAEMLAKHHPSVYAIGTEVPTKKKEEAKPAPEVEKPTKEKEAPAPKKRGRRPSAKK